ncbi:malate dehydrogenase, partial [Candidatus Peregrinibacteria bacterium RIFOXYA2_FULL_33_7]
MDYFEKSLAMHEKFGGKLEVKSKIDLDNKEDLSIAYTPGVAAPCKKIAVNPQDAYKYTMKKNTVAVITDSSAVLGLGNLGGAAGLPVMEGKCVLFKKFANIDAFPICLDTQNVNEIVTTIKYIAPGFGGINLEDISAPRCFLIEELLIKQLDIPVFHDDQHGTAIVVLAGIINSFKLADREIGRAKIVINGAGASGIAIAKLLIHYGARDIVLCDTKGAIYEGRDNLNDAKKEIALSTNLNKIKGGLKEAIQDADCFIGVSAAGVLNEDLITNMNSDPIIFAMANPIPEIMPEEAKKAGVRFIASGRSDYPNQV